MTTYKCPRNESHSRFFGSFTKVEFFEVNKDGMKKAEQNLPPGLAYEADISSVAESVFCLECFEEEADELLCVEVENG